MCRSGAAQYTDCSCAGALQGVNVRATHSVKGLTALCQSQMDSEFMNLFKWFNDLSVALGWAVVTVQRGGIREMNAGENLSKIYVHVC